MAVSSFQLLVPAVIMAGPYLSQFQQGVRSVAGPMAGNALPDDLRDPSFSADNFRKRLKTHLFRNALGHLAH